MLKAPLGWTVWDTPFYEVRMLTELRLNWGMGSCLNVAWGLTKMHLTFTLRGSSIIA